MKNYFLLLLALIAWSCQEKEPVQPNILFLFADDQRADALGISGNSILQTPSIDELARQGVRFTNAYVMGGHHGAICMASRAMLFSGRQLFQVYDRLQGLETMTMDFAKAGYTTFGTGKWHNEREAFEASFQQAKTVYLGGMADHYAISVRDYDSLGRLGEPEIKGYSTEIFTQSAIDFIKSQEGATNPFFCYVAFTVPHDPYSPNPESIGKYPDGSIPLPPNYLPLHPFQFDQLTVFFIHDCYRSRYFKNPWRRHGLAIHSSCSGRGDYELAAYIDLTLKTKSGIPSKNLQLEHQLSS